jgi:hypothetical protein
VNSLGWLVAKAPPYTAPQWLLVEVIYFAVAAALFAGAYKAKTGWGKAGLGSLALTIIAWHLFAILPSWWLYYSDGVLDWGGNGCTALDVKCLKQAAKDTVVVIENAAVLGAFVVAFLMYQKKFPKQLAPGEKKPEATGGYK